MMEDYLSFRKMITPVIIQVIFWIGAVVVAVYALWQVFTGATASYGGGALVLRGLVTLVLGPFIWRICCEVMIVLFLMNETLTEIKKKVGKK